MKMLDTAENHTNYKWSVGTVTQPSICDLYSGNGSVNMLSDFMLLDNKK